MKNLFIIGNFEMKLLETFLFCCVPPLPNIHRPEPFFNEQPCVCDYFVLLVPTVAEEKISFHSNFFCLKDKNVNLLISAVGSLFGHSGQSFVKTFNFFGFRGQSGLETINFFGLCGQFGSEACNFSLELPKKVVVTHFGAPKISTN